MNSFWKLVGGMSIFTAGVITGFSMCAAGALGYYLHLQNQEATK